MAASSTLRMLADGRLPEISIVAPEAINGAYGAFDAATSTIMISQNLVRQATTSEALLVSVLIEELGHYVDAMINSTDAPGDEGEIFARMVQGQATTSAELQSLQSQNDHAVVDIAGSPVALELATVFGTVTLDGSLADWSVSNRLDTIGGVAGYQVYGQYEADSFVFALNAPVAVGPNTTFWLDTDRDTSTGYQVWGFAAGAEYNINFDAAGVPHLYTGADGQTLVAGAAVDVAFNANRTIAEFAVAGTSLGGSQGLNTYIDVNNSVFLPTSYANFTYTVAAPVSPPPVTVGNVTLDGSLSDWTTGDRIDTSLGVAGYEVFGKLTGDNYVMALKAPVPITTNTTAWLNVDQSAATGYQIWGFAGGAEYNVNMDSTGNMRLFTGSAGETAVANADIIERQSADRTVIEFAIPKELIGFTGTAAPINTLFDINDTTFLSTSYATAQYTITPPTAPVVGTITLDGSLSDWAASYRIDGVAPVAGYEVYGTASGDSYVFALRAPAGTPVGAGTTAWLNTDQNAATGFQIFGTSGGAEFNIDFDVGGVPFLYSGDAGQTLTQVNPLLHGRSTDGTVVEFSVAKSALGNTAGLGTLLDVNNTTFLPGNFAGPQYSVIDSSGLPSRTDFSKKVAIVYSDTTAARYFGNADVNINETGYSQLFMAAQNQAAMAGIPFDVISEADLKDLAKLVDYDAIVFPSFQYVNAADAAVIENNLTLLAQNYDTSFIAAGNFMTADENGTLLAGDAYARMKVLFDLQPQASGFAGSTSVAITSTGTGFAGVGGYEADENIKTYANPVGVGWLAFSDMTPGVTPLTSIARQTVVGAGAGIYDAVLATSVNGDRNVHFSSEALLGDNNQLWQAIQYAVNGATGPSVGLQLGRQTTIVASRNDMDQSQFQSEVDPTGATPGIYDELLPILQNWKDTYNFVGSYYINVGDSPSLGEQTVWRVSMTYYEAILAMGNEIGSHSLTHLLNLTPSENTNILTTGSGPGTFEYEFLQSREAIQTNIAASVPGYQIAGAAVPGAPEYLATAEQIIQYYDYLSGGYAAVGAGYPGAIGYLTPDYDDLGKIYIAPNMKFDFTLIGFENKTSAQALAEWQAEFASLSSNAEVPVIVWPWHDYGPTNWENGGYTEEMFTQFIATAANADAEFVTLADLAQRVESFEQSAITSSVDGNVVSATVTSTDAGRFALDLDNIGSQVIASVADWYAYDTDSVFTDRDGGSFTINLGTVQSDVTHITSLPMRGELVSLNGDGSNLNFTVNGEGRVVVDLKNVGGTAPVVTGASIVSLVGEILTLDLGANGTHNVTVALQASANQPPVITSNGGASTATISVAEGSTAVTTVTATNVEGSQTLTYSLAGGADQNLFTINPNTGALAFASAPDFEAPLDADADRNYDVVVGVADNGVPSAADTQAITVTLSDVAGLTLNGNASANTLDGASEEDSLSGAGGNDTLNGGAGSDVLDGGAGNDTLNGNGGSDSLDGGEGADRLVGGAGIDLMKGDLGADTFVFVTAAESGSGTTRDRIVDFTPGLDKLDIGAFDANTTVAGTQDFAFLAAAGAAITGAGQLHFRHDTANGLTYVEGNTNANVANMEFQIILNGILTLSTNDFIL